jgi:predicted RNA methylase
MSSFLLPISLYASVAYSFHHSQSVRFFVRFFAAAGGAATLSTTHVLRAELLLRYDVAVNSPEARCPC